MTYRNNHPKRTGSVAVLVCALIMPLLMLLALSVDYGFLCYIETELQRAADQAAIAGVQDLTPDDWGNQDTDRVRQTVREYVANNLGSDFVVSDNDIEIGRYNPATVYSDFEILNSGTYDTVRVTLRRTDLSNHSVSLFFARLFNRNEADVNARATAILQKARYLGPGTGVLPITVSETAWDEISLGDEMSVYGDGKVVDSVGDEIPGNWGTLDIGDESNATSGLRDQIVNGLSQNDLDALHEQGTIPSNEYIDSQQEVDLNGDPGFSSGMKQGVEDVHGITKVMPIYSTVTGSSGSGGSPQGNNTTYEVVRWVAVRVIDSRFAGSKNSYIEVRKSFLYDAALIPHPDLSNQDDVIENAYTSPVLVQ